MAAVPAQELAARRVAAVRDDPAGRLDLLRGLYDTDGTRQLSYRRAASAFMGWQLRRGLLNPPDAPVPGSPWWRAVNERLLADGSEARELSLGHSGSPSNPGVVRALEFLDRPSAERWYRAHNTSVVGAYLDHEELAAAEGRVERFFLNLVLLRVLYAHALVAAPRLALGRLAPVAHPLGDPRLGMTAMFLSLSRVLPARYPLGEDVTPYLAAEQGIGRLLDVGVILPRLGPLYSWSAETLQLPALNRLLHSGIPCYAWDPADADCWHPAPTLPARLARRLT